MWFYVSRILVPYQRADAAAHERPRGNLSDLYPRWLGARELFGDRELMPIKGQLTVLLPQPEVDYAMVGMGLYMFPRRDGIVLGGTFERGVETMEPNPEAYLKNIEQLASDLGNENRMAWTGVAPHSVRAVPLDYLKEIIGFANERKLPVHMRFGPRST